MMQPTTGDLMMVESMTDLLRAEKEGYKLVPSYLERAARKKLAGKKTAKVRLTSGGKLSRWAAGKRKKRQQMAKVSRRANRC